MDAADEGVGLGLHRKAGAPWATLARELDVEMPREDGALWRPSTVRDLLRTPMYVGRLERTVGGELVVVDDAHEPLVSRALWERVVNGRGAARGPVRRREPAVLAGLVRCAGCGGPMSRGTGGRKYVALYHLATPDVQATPGWKEAATSGWTSRLTPHFQDRIRLVCRRYVRGA